METNVEVERLRIEILFRSHYRRRKMIYRRDGHMRSHAPGTELDEPGVPHAVTQQTEQQRTFPRQASADGFFHVHCTRTLEQVGTILSQAGVGVKSKTTATARVAPREEFAGPPKNRQQ